MMGAAHPHLVSASCASPVPTPLARLPTPSGEADAGLDRIPRLRLNWKVGLRAAAMRRGIRSRLPRPGLWQAPPAALCL
jgi:hypothetical protein